jgi:uncharacterized protein (TIGR03435 family)
MLSLKQPFTESQMIARLQNLLVDTFKLEIDKEQKPGTIYVLTVDPGGLKIKKNGDATAYLRAEFAVEGRGETAKIFVNATAITINRLIFTAPFWNLRGAPVLDATRLVDRYDIHWMLGEASDADRPPLEPTSVIETCKRELGLQLEAKKGQVDVINITRAEKPTENRYCFLG